MKRMTTRTAIIGGAAAAALLLGGGVAFAFWTSNGSGTGTAEAGVTTALTITPVAAPTDLYPDGPAQLVTVNVANDSDSDVKLASVDVDVTSAPPLCLLADFTVTTVDTDIIIPGGGNVDVDAANIALENTAVNQDACKGATLGLTFTAVPAA
jgi:hypothetical protein